MILNISMSQIILFLRHAAQQAASEQQKHSPCADPRAADHFSFLWVFWG